MNNETLYIASRYHNGKWKILGKLYAPSEEEAWIKARKKYGSPISQVITEQTHRWFNED